MRLIIVIIYFFLISTSGYSQLFTKKKVLNNENFDKPSVSWGYFLGVNNYDFNFDYVSDTYDIQTEKSFGFIILWFLVFVLFDPAKSAEPPIKFGSFDTISKNFSELFLVAIGFKSFR